MALVVYGLKTSMNFCLTRNLPYKVYTDERLDSIFKFVLLLFKVAYSIKAALAFVLKNRLLL